MCREPGAFEATARRRPNGPVGLNAEDDKRIQDLQRENAALTRLLAEVRRVAFEGHRKAIFQAHNATVTILSTTDLSGQ